MSKETLRMTLSQANRKISKLKGKLKDLEGKASQSVTYEAEKVPAYEFGKLVEQAAGVRTELEALEAFRTKTNVQTEVKVAGVSMTLTQAVIRLAELRGQIAWYQGLPVRPHAETTEVSLGYDTESRRVPVKKTVLCRLPEAERQAIVDRLQSEFDELNDAVETVDHQTFLIR